MDPAGNRHLSAFLVSPFVKMLRLIHVEISNNLYLVIHILRAYAFDVCYFYT